MQNAGPDSRLFRPALVGLALTMFVAATPAAAGDRPLPADPFGPPARLAEGRTAAPVVPGTRPRLWLTRIGLGLSDAQGDDASTSVGLAYRMADWLSLGAGGRIDPADGAFTGVIALDIRF